MARLVLRALCAVAVALGLAGGAAAQVATPDRVIVGRVEGVINPITARYVDRLVSDAEESGARAVLLGIDTPGGTLDATSRITGRMLNARVPLITYGSPAGARAASAGTFITLAGHVAAMGPWAHLGGAHP